MDLKALIFDLDGTIYELDNYLETFAELQRTALKKLVPATNLEMTLEEMYRPLQMPNAQSRLFLSNNWRVQPDVYWAELHSLDLAQREKCLESGFLKQFDDAHILKKLQNGYKIGLLTNTPKDIADLELSYCGLSDVFDAKVCAFYKDEFSKPEPRGAQLLLDLLKVTPSQAIMIGDSDVDIETGRLMGMKTILKRDSQHSYTGPEPDYKISSFDDLLNVLACFEI